MPTSGKKPIPVSGIAKSVLSVATRTWPCTDSPTPPPITMPSSNETMGMRLEPSAWLRVYSSWTKARPAASADSSPAVAQW